MTRHRVTLGTLLVAFLSTGCKSSGGIGAEASLDASSPDTSSPKSDKTDFSYWSLDMKKQIQTGDEPWVQSVNDIFQCANDESGAPAICYQTCISRFFPQNRRYALYLSGYVPNNRCFASVLEWPRYDGVLSSYKLYNGAYQTYMRDGVTTGRCSGIDVERPDVDAYHQFSMVTVPSGQLTPHPGGLRVYDVLTLFSDASGQNLLTSYFLTEWSTVEGDLVTPNRYEYLDGSGHATFGQTAGFDCAKRAEITNEVVLSFQPGQ